jgi:hypothetical protein
MSNCREILDEVSARCSNREATAPWHRHVVLTSGRAKATESYPPQLICAILRGLKRHLAQRGRMVPGDVGTVICEEADYHMPVDFDEAWDDVSGAQLDTGKVKAARAEEVDVIREFGVYTKVPLTQCWEETGKAPIDTRWIDINKGDSVTENYRSRFVAKDFKWREVREDTFAATPPLEAFRYMLSSAMTRTKQPTRTRRKLRFLDASRAHFHSPALRPIFIKLPAEDDEQGMCGKLNKMLYGTRDASKAWEMFYTKIVVDMGFVQGLFSPCLFWNEQRQIELWVHGDDFTPLAETESLDWFEAELGKGIKIKNRGTLGPDSGDVSEITCLNRIIRWTTDDETGAEVIEYEADPRHAEIFIAQLGLDGDRTKSLAVTGHKDTAAEAHLGMVAPKLPAAESRVYRSVCMRGNYLAADRPDIQFAAKECARHMSDPTTYAMAKLKKLGRYLKHRPRYVCRYVLQDFTAEVIAECDSDHAGCLRTRKSTNGLNLFHGRHWLRGAASTQSVIALSSGESEFYGIVKGTSCLLGLKSMVADLGKQCLAILYTDATAGKGIAQRRGAGKVRHLDTQFLWVQQKIGEKRLLVRKVKGTENTSDLQTKYLSAGDVTRLMSVLGFVVREGISAAALKANV